MFQCLLCRRAQSCRSSSAGAELSEEGPADTVKMTKPKTFQAYLPNCHRTYSCVHCRTHLANHDELISKSFQGSQGRAYLFNAVVNVGCGPAEERVLLTGLHAVADIYCENCRTTLGWKYGLALGSLSGTTLPSLPLISAYLDLLLKLPDLRLCPAPALAEGTCRSSHAQPPPAWERPGGVAPVLVEEHAFESSQKYKEGKFIIELAHMIKDNGWE
ncbi:protein yippee-like 1 isoform X1 [Manis pentadactyla]|uniref:protein yippee-like 1 isoform X1 n=1 Tax=Manis pentadactyla TaxID=143292 RepID=UPI00255C57CB|nr:protein yippee-like 1 isoform X1 [Manis pentadactyla]